MWRSWAAGWRRIPADRRHELVAGLLSLLMLLPFLNLAGGLLQPEVVELDARVTAWVQGFRSPVMTVLMRGATALGSPVALTILALGGAAFLLRRRYRRESLALLASLVLGWGWDEVLKRLFRRARPPGPWLAEAFGYSFPSGHSVAAVAFYGVLAYYLARFILPRRWRPSVMALAGGVIALIGLSRVYLGVHYPSDVLGGFALGGAWASLCVLVASAIR